MKKPLILVTTSNNVVEGMDVVRLNHDYVNALVKAGHTEFGDAPDRRRTLPAGQDHDSDPCLTGTDDSGAILCTELFQFISRAVIIDTAVREGAVHIQNNVFNHMPAP